MWAPTPTRPGPRASPRPWQPSGSPGRIASFGSRAAHHAGLSHAQRSVARRTRSSCRPSRLALVSFAGARAGERRRRNHPPLHPRRIAERVQPGGVPAGAERAERGDRRVFELRPADPPGAAGGGRRGARRRHGRRGGDADRQQRRADAVRAASDRARAQRRRGAAAGRRPDDPPGRRARRHRLGPQLAADAPARDRRVPDDLPAGGGRRGHPQPHPCNCPSVPTEHAPRAGGDPAAAGARAGSVRSRGARDGGDGDCCARTRCGGRRCSPPGWRAWSRSWPKAGSTSNR